MRYRAALQAHRWQKAGAPSKTLGERPCSRAHGGMEAERGARKWQDWRRGVRISGFFSSGENPRKRTKGRSKIQEKGTEWK